MGNCVLGPKQYTCARAVNAHFGGFKELNVSLQTCFFRKGTYLCAPVLLLLRSYERRRRQPGGLKFRFRLHAKGVPHQ